VAVEVEQESKKERLLMSSGKPCLLSVESGCPRFHQPEAKRGREGGAI
jgi:hypothetical protein